MERIPTFVTGNPAKAEYAAKYLGVLVRHRKLDLYEIQSLNLREIVEHKARQAFAIVGSPVVVEDVSLEFSALGKLPGPFIRFFLDELSFETMCSLLDGKPRDAMARCVLAYFDGEKLECFDGELPGRVAEAPAAEGGYGWDRIFVPEGYDVTRAELGEEDDQKTYLRLKPFKALKSFVETQL